MQIEQSISLLLTSLSLLIGVITLVIVIGAVLALLSKLFKGIKNVIAYYSARKAMKLVLKELEESVSNCEGEDCDWCDSGTEKGLEEIAKKPNKTKKKVSKK